MPDDWLVLVAAGIVPLGAGALVGYLAAHWSAVPAVLLGGGVMTAGFALDAEPPVSDGADNFAAMLEVAFLGLCATAIAMIGAGLGMWRSRRSGRAQRLS